MGSRLRRFASLRASVARFAGNSTLRSARRIFADAHVAGENDLILFPPAGGNSARLSKKNEPGLCFYSPGFSMFELFNSQLQEAFSDVFAAFAENGFLFFGEMQFEDLLHAFRADGAGERGINALYAVLSFHQR